MTLRQALMAVAGVCLASSAPAQSAAATMRGRVTDRMTGTGIPNARLTMLRDSRSVTTDSLGAYEFRDVPAGSTLVMVSARPYPVLNFSVTLADGDRFTRNVIMDSSAASRAQALEPVDVTASSLASFRLASFERRRVTGRGQYMTELDIIKTGAYTVAEAVRGLRGVIFECGGGGGCFVRMARAPARCIPEFIVDDQVMNDFGPSTPIRDVVGIELYTGPTDVPGEYAGRNAGCGVVVLWTRAGAIKPPR